MIKLIQPYLVPAFGAACGLCLALGLALLWSISSHADTRAERNALQSRINTILTSQEIENEVDELTPDARRRELCERLSGCPD